MFFDSASDLLRVIVVGSLAYVSLIALLRISGKRTLSKMNAFDLVVTVALGSTLATVLLSKDVSLAEGILAFGLLVFLQFLVSWTSVRSKRIESWVKAEPRLLFRDGEFLTRAMKAERVTADEVLAAIRQNGPGNPDLVQAVVLETDGSMSVTPARGDG
jgi:uncharacterized membrane protein YcaP (DUF421 family)